MRRAGETVCEFGSLESKPNEMLVSGVFLSASAVALLARCLQRAGQIRLADDVGFALDADWDEMKLAPSEEAAILSVLAHCPDLLRPLRDALQANTGRHDENPA